MLYITEGYDTPNYEIMDFVGHSYGGTKRTEEEALQSLVSKVEKEYEEANGIIRIRYESCGLGGRKVYAAGNAVKLQGGSFYYNPCVLDYRNVAEGTVVRLWLRGGNYADIMLLGPCAESTLFGVYVKLLRSPWSFGYADMHMLVSTQSCSDVDIAYQSPLIFPMQRLSRTDTLRPGVSVGFQSVYAASLYAVGAVDRVEVRSTSPATTARESRPKRGILRHLFG